MLLIFLRDLLPVVAVSDSLSMPSTAPLLHCILLTELHCILQPASLAVSCQLQLLDLAESARAMVQARSSSLTKQQLVPTNLAGQHMLGEVASQAGVQVAGTLLLLEWAAAMQQQ